MAATVLWAAIVFYLHLASIKLPTDEELFKIPHADKAVHFLMFFVLAFLLTRSLELHIQKIPSLIQLAGVVVLCVSYGALLEFLQSAITSERDGSFWDWLADLLGSISGSAIAVSALIPLFIQNQRRKYSK